MAVLQGKRRGLVGEPEFLGPRPKRHNIGRGRSRPDQRDRGVHVLAAAHVGVPLRPRGTAHGERPVVAGAVAEMAVQDVEEGRVAGPDQPVGVDVRVRRAALAGDRVDPLHVLAAEAVEDLADQAHALVLAHPGPQELIELRVGGVDHRARLRQQRDLVAGLGPPCLHEDLLAVHGLDALGPERGEHRHLGHVDAERRVGDAVLAQLGGDLAGHIGGDAGIRVERAAQRGDAGPGPGLPGPLGRGRARGVIQPGVVQLVVPGGRPEVPHHRFPAPGQQREPDELVHRPGADVGRRHVADVREVKAQQRAEVRPLELRPQPGQPFVTQPGQVDPFLPVHSVRPEGVYRHRLATSLSARPLVKSGPMASVNKY